MSTKENGVHLLMEREEYERSPRINWSTLKWMDLSPAHYRQAVMAPYEDSDFKKLGRACHIAVFEPDLFRSRCLRWDGGARRGKDWEAFVKAHPDDEILTEHQHDTALAVGRAVRASAMAQPYVSGGQSELTVLWESDGLPCKSRLDFVSEADAIVDLKTLNRIGGASPENFPWACKSMKYKTQAAFYRRAYQHATGKLLPYYLVAAETMPPYAVQVYKLKESDLADGELHFMRLLEAYKGCRERNLWNQYSVDVLPLELPGDYSGDGDIAEDLGLTLGGTPAVGF